MPTLVCMLVVALICVACGESTDCMWPGRPDCQPVGTTLIVEVTDPGDVQCGVTQYFDEVGEAAFSDRWCYSS